VRTKTDQPTHQADPATEAIPAKLPAAPRNRAKRGVAGAAKLARTQAAVQLELAEHQRAEERLQRRLEELTVRHAATEARRRQELEALVDLSSALRQAQTREAMFLLLVEQSSEVMGSDAGALLLLQEGALVVAAGRGPSEALLGRRHPPDSDSLWRVMQTGVPLFIPDAGHSELGQGDLCRALMQGMTAAVFIPLKMTEATVGLLHLAYRARREFPETDRRLLTTIAEMAGTAWHRVGVMETLEQRVADRTRELAALYDVTSVASESLDLQTMLEQSLARVLVTMQSTVGTIHLLDEAEETLRLAAHQGISPAAWLKWTSPSSLPT